MIDIIYEDENFIALNKPAGILVHNTHQQTSSEPTITDWLRVYCPATQKVGDNPKERPGIVHRLDRDTSGVLLIAKNQPFFEHLKHLFQTHKIKKTYLALVWDKLKRNGIIDLPIGLKTGSVKRSVHTKGTKMIKEAITEYKTLRYIEMNGNVFSIVRLLPKTGRTHQLRVHMASIGHPIVGDPLYSRRDNPWNLKRQFLHAESIEFSAINGQRIKIEAELPNELSSVIPL